MSQDWEEVKRLVDSVEWDIDPDEVDASFRESKRIPISEKDAACARAYKEGLMVGAMRTEEHYRGMWLLWLSLGAASISSLYLVARLVVWLGII